MNDPSTMSSMSGEAPVQSISRIVRMLLCCVVALLLVVAPNAFGSSLSYPALSGKWQLGQFTADGGFAVGTPRRVPAEGVTFPFLERPDTIFLVTDNPAYKGRLLGDLTGKTLAARIGVDVTPGTQFSYFGEPDGSDIAANVRLYFETDISLGPIVCPCQDKGWSSFWYSDPVRLDLETLKTSDATLSAKLDPGLWADGQETPADADDAHRRFFEQAAAHVDHIGLTFAGGHHLHNGAGAVPGTGGGFFRLFGYQLLGP